MTIRFPRDFPTLIGPSKMSWRIANATLISRSQFTFAEKVIAHPGQMWGGTITLPPMNRVEAEQWVAWLTSMEGHVGTFVMQDPMNVTPRGSMAGEGRYNLILNTDDFDNPSWAKSSGGTGINPVVTINTITDPLGGAAADSVVFNSGAGGGGGDISTLENGLGFTGIIGDPYTGSLHIKSASGGETMVMRHAGKSSYTTINVTSAWQRLNTIEIAAGIFIPLRISMKGDIATGTQTVHLWGGQMVSGEAQRDYQSVGATLGPIVKGGSQSGKTLDLDGAATSETGWALAGDLIQLGSGSEARLHKVLTDADSDSGGNVTLDLWPRLRTSPDDNSLITVDNCKGVFRLVSNITEWDIDTVAYGITFGFVESIV